MQITANGIAVLAQFCQAIFNLKNGDGSKHFIAPSIELFLSPISSDTKDQLRQNIIVLNVHAQLTSYVDIVSAYQKNQESLLYHCIDAIISTIDKLCIDKNNMAAFFEKMQNFISNPKLSFLAPGLSGLELLNPATSLRLMYYLVNQIISLLITFRDAANSTPIIQSDHAIIENIIKITDPALVHADKRSHLNKLFYDELHIREASIIATGQLPRNEQLSDIFIVYNAASHGASNSINHEYYLLVTKTLSHLSKASSLMRASTTSGSVTVDVRPMNCEVSLRDSSQGGTLVRRDEYGVQISYEGGTALTSFSPNYSYTVTPCYRLKPELKIAYLAHIERLNKQMITDPKHPHAIKRTQKIAALQRVVEADDEGDLSASIFEQAKDKKPYLFVAYGSSKTKTLIEQAEADIKDKMWRKLSKEKSSIGKYGYSISDQSLLQKLIAKHASFIQPYVFNVNTPIDEFFTPDVVRITLQGNDLWNYDKKIALEIILLYHAKQLLHPALFTIIEEQFITVYERSFSFFRASAVEQLILEIKENLLLSFWKDAANSAADDTPQLKRFNNV